MVTSVGEFLQQGGLQVKHIPLFLWLKHASVFWQCKSFFQIFVCRDQ